MPVANSTGILSFTSGYKLMQAVRHLFRWKAPQDYAWQYSVLHYGFLRSNSSTVQVGGRSDWTDIFQNTLAFENRHLSTKRTIFERGTCRADLEQAEQCRHDGYKLPQSLKYWGLLVTPNPGRGLNHEYRCFILVNIFEKELLSLLCVHNSFQTLQACITQPHAHVWLVANQGRSPSLGYREEGGFWGQVSWAGTFGLIIYSIYELDWASVCSSAKWGEYSLTHRISVRNWSC